MDLSALIYGKIGSKAKFSKTVGVMSKFGLDHYHLPWQSPTKNVNLIITWPNKFKQYKYKKASNLYLTRSSSCALPQSKTKIPP